MQTSVKNINQAQTMQITEYGGGLIVWYQLYLFGIMLLSAFNIIATNLFFSLD